MRRLAISMVLAPALVLGCAKHSETVTSGTLAELRDVNPDVQEEKIEEGLDQAMQHYRRFLEEAPETAMTPEAMRRLADLQVEKQFGVSAGDGKPQELAAPEAAPAAPRAPSVPLAPVAGAASWESDQDFEIRTTAASGILANRGTGASLAGVMPDNVDPSGPLEAIALYDRLLTEYPNYEHRDKVLYQKARAYDELGRTEEAGLNEKLSDVRQAWQNLREEKGGQEARLNSLRELRDNYEGFAKGVKAIMKAKQQEDVAAGGVIGP